MNLSMTDKSVKLFLLTSVSAMLVIFSACTEERKVIVPFIPVGDRVVLLEEFTGKGCTNCPKGSREIESLLTQFPNHLVAVSIHAGFFADPQTFNIGQYDLRTDEGEFLYSYMSPNLGYPSAVVDRTPVGGILQIGLSQWSSAIVSELEEEPSVELSLTRTYNETTREVTLMVDGIGKQTVTGEIRISVMLTESEIVDAQYDTEAGGLVSNYIHNHVLRDMITPAAGEPLFNDLSVGQTFNHAFSTILNQDWKADYMDMIVFVSVVNGDDFPVLQAASIKVIP